MNDYGLDTLIALARENPTVVLVVAGAWVALMVAAVALGGARWRLARPLALLAAILSAVSAMVTVPGISKISFDWGTLFLIAAGFGVITFAFAWPAIATALRQRD